MPFGILEHHCNHLRWLFVFGCYDILHDLVPCTSHDIPYDLVPCTSRQHADLKDQDKWQVCSSTQRYIHIICEMYIV